MGARWLFAIIVLVCAALGCSDTGERPPAGRADPPATAGVEAPAELVLQSYGFGGDFVLTDQQGKPFDLARARGRVHLLFFGFTMCPDVCPMTLSRIARAVNLLSPDERAAVTTLFVTVDVDRDTPAVLANHLKGFPVPVVGLTGTRAQVDAVVAQYRASYEITPSDSAAGPSVSHSTYTYLIDRHGNVRALFRLGDSPEQIAAGLRLAWQEGRGTTPSAPKR